MAGTAKVRLVSNALLLLGGQTISSFDDNSTGAVLGENLFDTTYKAMLQNHRWGFAKKTKALSRLSDTPNGDYQYAFLLPSDFLYLAKGSSYKFDLVGDTIQTNDKEFELEYIASVSEDRLPEYFAKALEFNLASLFAIPLTGDIDKSNYYSKVFIDQLRKAKAADSTMYPEVSIQDTPYLNVRY